MAPGAKPLGKERKNGRGEEVLNLQSLVTNQTRGLIEMWRSQGICFDSVAGSVEMLLNSTWRWEPMPNRTGTQPDASYDGSGSAKTRGFVHSDQKLLNATQNSLCGATESTARSVGVQSEQLLTEGRFSRLRSSPSTESPDHPAQKCRRKRVMGRALSEHCKSSSQVKLLILQVFDLLANDNFYFVKWNLHCKQIVKKIINSLLQVFGET